MTFYKRSALVLVLLLACTAQAADIYVDAVNGDNTRTTAEAQNPLTPWKTLTAAATGAAVGDTVHVAAGTYNAATGESFPIDLGSNKNYIGAGKTLTTVEGSGSADVLQLTASVTIDAFHIKFTGNYKGVKISGSSADIKNCKVSSDNNGNGLYFDGTGTASGGRISTCEVSNCMTGISLIGTNTSAVTIENSEIYYNQYNNIYIYDYRSPVDIHKNIIRDCPVLSSPCGAIMLIAMDDGSEYVTIDRNTIVRNRMGVYSYSSSSTYVTVKNNIIVNKLYLDQRGDQGSYGFTNWFGGTFNNTYNDVWNNYKDYNAGSRHNTEISAFPRFVNAANNDFRLYSDSPCLGAGEGGVNMGAYDGAGEAGSPYRTTSYVSDESGTDAVTEGGAWDTPYKTVTYANRYTEGIINVGQGTYSTTETIYLIVNKEIKGVGSGQATLECSVNNKNVIETWLNSTIEGISIKIKGNPDWPYTFPYGIRALSSNIKIVEAKVYSSVANGGTGIYFDGGGDTSSNTGGSVSTCEIYNCGSGIVFATGASDPVTIEGCDIHHNYTNNVYISWASPVRVYRNIIRDCPCSSSPVAAVFITGMDSGNKYVTVDRNTIVRNKIGVYSYSSSSTYVTIKNNIIVNKPYLNQRGEASSYGFTSWFGGTFNNTYNDVWNNFVDYNAGSKHATEISAFPRFVDAGNNNFRLYSDSPCLAVGEGGVNMGAYDGVGEAGSPYRMTSYVSYESGTDAVTEGSSWSTPYKTVTYANQYTEKTINVGQGTYTTSETIYFVPEKEIKGVGSGLATLECSTGDGTAIITWINSTLEGVTVKFTGTGNGILVRGSNTNISNNLIYSNYNGSGIYFDGTSTGLLTGGRITSCEVYNCDNGIYLYGNFSSTPSTIESCIVRGNEYRNIGVFDFGTQVDIYRNVIRDCPNGPGGNYGGIYCYAMDGGNEYVTINRNTVVKNKVGVVGAFCSGRLTTSNNIISNQPAGDTAPDSGSYGIYGVESGYFINSYNDVYWNETDYNNTSAGDGSISATAEFVSVPDNDYHLTVASPCINAGIPEGTEMGAYDYEGPTVTLKTPNGGETWQAGIWQDITWEASDADLFNLYYITNEATGYQTITTEVSGASRSYAWLVPNSATTTAKVSIEAIKASVIATDESDAVFTIDATTDFYVDAVNGSNTYNGLTSEVSGLNGPWKNISYAATQAATSSAIHAAAGTYNEGAGESFPITISNQYLISTNTYLATIEEDGSATKMFDIGTDASLEGFSLKGNGSDRIISVNDTGVIIKNNNIQADGYSYAIFSNKNNTTIEGNTIWRASAGQTGVVIAQISSFCNIYKNEIRGFNYGIQDTQSSGGSRYIDRNTLISNICAVEADNVFGGTTHIKNNIICNNPNLDADYASSTYGIYAPLANVSATYNNVWKNASDYYGGVSAGTGSISDYPGFASPEATDYRLHSSNAYWTNPCIGAGEEGVNMGCYNGSVEAGVPYRAESYVSGSGNDTTGDGTSEATAWRTLTRANQYTVGKINAGAGTYNAGAGESAFPRNFSINRYIKGADRNAVTIEAGSSQDVVYLNKNSSLEGVTVKGSSGSNVIKINGTGVIIKDNLINASDYTYGIMCNSNSTSTIEGNLLWRTSTANDGIYAVYSTNHIINNEIRNFSNGIQDYGGGGGTYTYERNTIVKNTNGIFFNNSSGGTKKITNNIIASEVGGYSAGGTTGIYNWASSGANSTYNDIYANDNNWYLITSGEGDISREAHPLNPSGDDFHLMYNSPCIDSGDPTSSLDPDSSRADMGAYYYNQTTSATPCVYVKTPNGGESITGLTNYNITWYATDDGRSIDHIELYYSTDGGTTYPYTIIASTPNTGSFLWTVPNTPTSQARIRVIAVGSQGTDESDSDFTILQGHSTIPTVEVISPNGGEKWKGGSTHDITFTCTDEIGIKPNSANFYYSTGEGTDWVAIATDQATDAAYSWNPLPLISSTEVKVRVTVADNADVTGTDESNSVFTIDSTPPTVNVILPVGGEKWQGATDHDINWTATDNFTLEANPITLQYSVNSGTDYINIAIGEINDGAYSWPAPSLNTDEARVKILAVDECGNVGSHESGSDFIIDIEPPTAPVLIAPPDGLTTNEATPNFSWNASTDNLSGIASYEIIIDANIVTQDAVTSYTTPDALAEGPHTWKVKAKDGAGIWGSYSDTWSFTVDITSPEVAGITLKDRSTGSTQYSQSLTISVEANGVTGVPVSVQLAQDLAFTENDSGWLPYSAQTEYILTAGEGSRTVYYKVRDAASNESTPVNNTITVDTVLPGVESILLKDITSGSTIESNSLTVTVEASEVSAEASQLRVAQDVAFTENSTGWLTYIPTAEYTFTAGEGSRTAYYQVRDVASNESNIVNQSISIDTSGPSAAGVVLKDRIIGSTQYTNSATVSVEVHDATGSPAQMRAAQDAAFTVNDTGWLTYATTSEYAFTAGEGSRTAYFKMRDAAENESPTYSPIIILDTQPPSQVSLLTPANNSYTNDTTPTMTWNAAIDTTSGIASYEVVIDVTQIATLGAVTTFTTPDAESLGSHNWKVRAKDNAQNWGNYSDTWNLTIETTNPTVTLGKPRGGQTLEATASYNITWEAADDNGLKTNPVTLYFSSNAGSSWSTIEAGIAYVTGEGTYSWTIPNVNSTQCRVSIEVEDKAGNKAYDMSPADFTVSNFQPTSEVTYPNGGEYLKGNTSYNITWVATGEVDPVTINLRYSTNSGTNWTLIASNEVNDGTYAWTTPLIDSTACRVSIEATDGLGRVGTDQSNADFNIVSTAPTVEVVAPLGGERFAGGSIQSIRWTAVGTVGFPANPITFRYSTDSGNTWNLIAANQPNTSPYSWTVPVVNSTTVRVSVEATDYVGYTGTAQSASDFTIDSTQPIVTSISPTNGATSVPINTQVIIVFNKEMSREATQKSFALAGSFSWGLASEGLEHITIFSNGETMTFTPSVPLEYNTLYTVSLAATATDLAGNHLSAFSSTFTTAQRGDTEAPHIIIQRVDNQGVANTLKEGDYIPKQPQFKGVVTDNLGVDQNTIKFYLDDTQVVPTISVISPTEVNVIYTVTTDLADEAMRTHNIKLEAKDTAGNLTTKQIAELKVSYGNARVIGPVLAYPTTYNPLTRQPARIAYNLTADQVIIIYMFDISGQNIWTGRYPSGTEGGKAGYNEVPFYGKSELTGSYLGNGIYVYKLTAGNRVIGTGRITIF